MNDDEFDKKIFETDSWRVFRIISEFVDGFETLTQIGPSVSIFGSARLTPEHPYYSVAIELGEKIASNGFAIITGGGPGMMEAANKGAQNAKGSSCGLGILVPFEHETNPFIDPKYRLKFRYFFVRKVMFIRYAQACVFLPGGFGTLDEFFEALTLIQTEKIKPFPIYLVGTSFWDGLKTWIHERVLEEGCISEKDLDLIKITDDVDEVVEGINKHFQKDHSLKNF